MELKESLLQNEVQYLNKNFSIVSAELIAIQEFLEQEFGNKFKAFLNARRDQRLVQSSASQIHFSSRPCVGKCGTGTVSNYSSRKPKNSTRTQVPLATRRITRGSTRAPAFQDMTENKEVGEECTEISDDEDQPFIISEQDSDSSSVGYFDPLELDDSSKEEDGDGEQEMKPIVDSVLSLQEDLNATEPQSGVTGRRKSVVYRYFDKVQTENGKMKDKCKACGTFVSSQAGRLRNHTIKCQGRDKKVDKVSKKLKLKVPINKSVLNKSRLKGGRRLDRVRLVFKEHKMSDGILKMQCLICTQLVSNQANRLRNHLEKCSGQKGKALNDWIDSQVKSSDASSNLPDSSHNENDVTNESTSRRKLHISQGTGSTEYACLSSVSLQVDPRNAGNTNSSSSLILVPQTQDSAKPISSSCYESASGTNQSYPMQAAGWSESADTY